MIAVNQLPEQLAQDVRIREQIGEVLIVVGEKPATETEPQGISYLHISENIYKITGYLASELAETGLKVILPERWKDKHELAMLRELRAIRERGPVSKIMGSAGGAVRTVSFTKKNSQTGSLILPLYGYVIDEKPYLMGVVNEIDSFSQQVDYPSGEIDCFQSYGRGDFKGSNFPREMVHLLQDLRINAWLDTNDIPLAASDFMHVIRKAIAGASNVLFLAGPHSVCSPYCAEELRIATEQGKQILVVLVKKTGTVELTREAWSYLYPEAADKYDAMVADNRHIQSIQTEGLLKQFQPGLSQTNWLIWDETKGFPTFLPKIKKVIEENKDLKQQHTKFLLRAIEWKDNGQSAQFLLGQGEILEARDWLRDPGPNRVTSLIAQYISDSAQVRAGNFADVFICHDLRNVHEYEEMAFNLQLKGLSVWNDKNVFDDVIDDQTRRYRGIIRSANIVFIVSRDSINNDSCQAQIAYARDQNKPLYLALITPGLDTELPDYLHPYPLLDLTEQNKLPVISRLAFEFLQDGLDHKQAVARLSTQAKKNWNQRTKIPLNPEQLSTAIAYVKKGQYSKKYPPPPLVEEMLEFSLEEKKPFWMRAIPWVGGSVFVTATMFLLTTSLRPAPIPEELSEIRDWDFSLGDIERQTGISRDRIFQCSKELKDALPLPGAPDLQPISAMYGFAYTYDDQAEIIGRTIVCQATGIDPTKGIPKWIFHVPMDDPGYKRQLAAHMGNPRIDQDSRCFAAFDVINGGEVVAGLATSLEALDVEVIGVADPKAFEETVLHRVLVRSEFGLILSCPAQTVGSPIERRLGSYVSAAIQTNHLRSVDPEILLSIVRDKANGNRTALQIPPPVEIRRYAEDHEFRVALFIKASADGGEIDDPIQQNWVRLIENKATQYNSVVDLYDLPCQKCHLDQIVDLQHIATAADPPDGLIVAASNSLLIGAALKELTDQKVPIVAFDTAVDNPDLLAYVGPDNENLAYTVAKWAVNEAERGKALIINGPLIQENARDREQGFLQAIAENPLIENVGSGTGNWSEESAYNLALNMLGAFPDARLFLCANDRMALGVARAARELGKREQLIISGFDFIGPHVLDEIDATISQGSDEQAEMAADILFEYLRTGRPPEEQEIILNDHEVITASPSSQ